MLMNKTKKENNMKKHILMVVDYQNDFVAKNGVLPVPNAENIFQNIQNEIDSKKYDKVIYSFDTHEQNEYDVSEEKNLFPNIHCEYKTNGWQFFKIKPIFNSKFEEFVEKSEKPFSFINIKNKEFFFTKNKFDIWTGSKYFKDFIIKSFNPKIYDITVVGVATNYCVFSNIMGWKELGFKVNMKIDSVQGITHFPNGEIDESYQNNMNVMIDNNVKMI